MMKNIFIFNALFLTMLTVFPGGVAAVVAEKASTITEVACAEITRNLAYSATDMRTGGDVSRMQSVLINGQYLKGETTGFFGRATLASVKLYQKSKGLSPTGYVGPLTRGYMKKEKCADILVSSNAKIDVSTSTLVGSSPVATPQTSWGKVVDNNGSRVGATLFCGDPSRSDYLVYSAFDTKGSIGLGRESCTKRGAKVWVKCPIGATSSPSVLTVDEFDGHQFTCTTIPKETAPSASVPLKPLPQIITNATATVSAKPICPPENFVTNGVCKPTICKSGTRAIDGGSWGVQCGVLNGTCPAGYAVNEVNPSLCKKVFPKADKNDNSSCLRDDVSYPANSQRCDIHSWPESEVSCQHGAWVETKEYTTQEHCIEYTDNDGYRTISGPNKILSTSVDPSLKPVELTSIEKPYGLYIRAWNRERRSFGSWMPWGCVTGAELTPGTEDVCTLKWRECSVVAKDSKGVPFTRFGTQPYTDGDWGTCNTERWGR